jgi:hypothetical protein
MKLKLSTAVLGVMLGVVSFSSCLDEQFAEIDTTNLDQVMAESMKAAVSDDVVNEVNAAISYFTEGHQAQVGMQKAAAMVARPEVKKLTADKTYPAEFIIDFGDWGYTDGSGRVYRGQVYKIVYDILGRNAVVKDIELFVNDNQVIFTREYKNEEKVLNIFATESVKYKDGRTSEKYWERSRTLTEGNKDEWWNNSYSISGLTRGVTIHGLKYESTIIKPLIVSKGYRYYVSGVVETKAEKGTQLIDYGNGEEDNIAYKTINDGKPVKIELTW